MTACPPGSFRIVQISDSHVSHLGGATARNVARVVGFVNEQLRPDLVVHTGDLVAVTPGEEADRAAALAAHQGFSAPIRFLPGNHDVGEPGDAWMGLEVTRRWVRAHRAVFGPDRFVEELGGWTVVGCNSELFGSDLEEEEEQWAWLADVLGPGHRRPTVLFLHKPLWKPDAYTGEGQRCVPAAAGKRLLSLPGARMLRAVGNGHLHRYRRRVRDDLLEVWAPSVGFTGRAPAALTHFEQLGVVEWRLDADRVDAWFRAPVDLEELDARGVPEIGAEIARLQAAKRPGGDSPAGLDTGDGTPRRGRGA